MFITNAGAAKFEYLPKKAYDNLMYIVKREDGIITKNENTIIISEEKNGKNMEAKLFVSDAGKIDLELPYIYYLGYNIYLNNEKIDYIESENGFIEVKLDKKIDGNIANINLSYSGTTLDKISFVATLVGISLVIYFLFKKEKALCIEKKENLI